MKQELSRELLKTILTILVVLVLASAFLLFQKNRAPKDVYLSIVLRSDQSAVSQVFYNTGSGYSEKESQRQQIIAGESFSHLNFKLPGEAVESIRFDPTSARAEVQISEAAFTATNGTILQKLDLEAFAAVAPTAEASMADDILTVGVPEGSAIVDPQMTINTEFPLKLEYGMEVYYAEVLGFVGLYGLIFSLFYLWLRILTGMHLIKMLLALPRSIFGNLYLVNKP